MSEKVGVVNKCPNCGATVDTSMVKCPTCGYIFGGVAANVSAWKLSRLLENADANRRSEIVVNFPVPTTKADLLEFMADLQHRAKHYDEMGNPAMASAFKAKYRECAAKAHIYFENDPDFRALFKSEADSKKLRWRNLSIDTRRVLSIAIFTLTFLLFSFIIGRYDEHKKTQKEEAKQEEIAEFRDKCKDLSLQLHDEVGKGNARQAESSLARISIPKVLRETDDLTEAASCIDNAFIVVVQYYLDIGDKKAARRVGDIFYSKVNVDFFETATYRLLRDNGIDGFI